MKAKPVEKGKIETVETTVKARIYEARTLFFRQQAGTAARDGKEWEMSVNVGGMVPMIRLPDGRWVVFPWDALIDAANKAAKYEG